MGDKEFYETDNREKNVQETIENMQNLTDDDSFLFLKMAKEESGDFEARAIAGVVNDGKSLSSLIDFVEEVAERLRIERTVSMLKESSDAEASIKALFDGIKVVDEEVDDECEESE